MTIDEQIEAAWEDESPKVRESLQCSRASQVLGAAEIGFTAGYRAALRGLYRDSTFEECQDGDWFSVLADRGWVDAMKIGDGFEVITVTGDCEFTCCREDVKRIVYASLPSPSTIFGEGV